MIKLIEESTDPLEPYVVLRMGGVEIELTAQVNAPGPETWVSLHWKEKGRNIDKRADETIPLEDWDKAVRVLSECTVDLKRARRRIRKQQRELADARDVIKTVGVDLARQEKLLEDVVPRELYESDQEEAASLMEENKKYFEELALARAYIEELTEILGELAEVEDAFTPAAH